MNHPNRQSVLFIAHGSPMNLMEKTSYSADMDRLRLILGQRPKPDAIVYVSSHWTTRASTGIASSDHPPQMYDFYGFPPELYRIPYRPKGEPRLADTILALIGSEAFLDPARGIDHAGWAVGTMLFPEADIPSLSISVREDLSIRGHYELGRRLATLCDSNVLIVASGNIVHNLRFASFDTNALPHPLAKKFSDTVRDAVLENNFIRIAAMEDGEEYAFASPTPDHFMPLAVAMGAAGQRTKPVVFHDSVQNGTVSMLSFGWGL